MWGDVDQTELRQVWADELSRYQGEDIRDALEAIRHSYKDFPPTLYQFADLCRDAATKRKQTVLSLPNKVRDPMPEEIKEKLAAFLRKRA